MRAEDLTWEEYGAQVNDRIAILPVGSTEQHGPHLPLNVDVVITTRLAEMLASRIQGLVLPSIVYGCRPLTTSCCGDLFPGTTSLEVVTLIDVVSDVIGETYRHGARRFLILNGHWENVPSLVESAYRLVSRRGDAKVVVMSWWDVFPQSLIEPVFAGAGFDGWEKEHAALVETSLMLHFAPGSVRRDRILDDGSERLPLYAVLPQPADIIPKSGVGYKATYASEEKGGLIADQLANAIAEATLKELTP
jgi:creatinine amidohydrolase